MNITIQASSGCASGPAVAQLSSESLITPPSSTLLESSKYVGDGVGCVPLTTATRPCHNAQDNATRMVVEVLDSHAAMISRGYDSFSAVPGPLSAHASIVRRQEQPDEVTSNLTKTHEWYER